MAKEACIPNSNNCLTGHSQRTSIEKEHLSNSDTGIASRLLTRQQAATYCGVSVPTFMAVCPISPVALGEGKRMERYDIRSLDAWLDKLGKDGASLDNDWLAKLDSEHDRRSR
jgi:hypothetical protein